MSRIINAEGVRRSDMPCVPPSQIIVQHQENTRLYSPDVSDLVLGFETIGQLQPCVVRPIPGGFIQLVAGYRRWLAAMELVKRQKKAGVAIEDQFKLKCIVEKMGPGDALLRNISENADRRSLSPIENAVAIQRLRSQHGWNDAEGTEKIAKVFGYKSGWVTKTEGLLALSEDERFAVHTHFVTEGREGISQSVGEILAKVPEDRRAKALKEAEEASMKGKENIPKGKDGIGAGISTGIGTGKKSGANIRVRDMAEAASNNGAVIAKARPVAELYELIDGYAETEALHPLHPLTQELFKVIRGFMSRANDAREFDIAVMKVDGLAHAYYETYSKEKHHSRSASGRVPVPKVADTKANSQARV